jgi:hypothetical protein
VKRALTAVAVVLAAGTAIGLAILWPGHDRTQIHADLALAGLEAAHAH